MDQIDHKILTCLKDNARQKASAISDEINLSVSSVIDRIHKMETSGIIQGYTVVLDQKRLGNDVTAVMEVSLEHPNYYDDFVKMVQENKNIVSCYYLTGDYDFILKILTHSSDSLEQIYRQIKSIQGVSATHTHFVLKTVKSDIAAIPDPEQV